MSLRIEDYGLIGDCQTAALVGRDGSIDWLCLPRFDSGACFAAILGTHEHGRWLVHPTGKIHQTRRRYRGDTLILETEFETEDGSATLIDFMSPRGEMPDLVRIVAGTRGRVHMRTELIFRFGYGSIVPWVRRCEGSLRAVAGPDSVRLVTPVELRGENFHTVGEFTVHEGEQTPFVLVWHPSHKPAPPDVDAMDELHRTESWWRDWAANCTYDGAWREAVVRSAIVLKALIYEPTGGIIAAPTTSLPEHLGGVRNWDYRYCWLRDATFTLYALMIAGYKEEALAWRDWLLRAVAGKASQMQIMYGVAGERRLSEWEVDWLPGYEGAKPVRIGNAAHLQFQLDVYGEVMDSLHLSRRIGLPPDDNAWRVQQELLDFLESHWNRPDEGIWEIRGPRRDFTHSKVMCWVAFDRAVKAIEHAHLEGPVERWRHLRDTIHEEVCQKGFNPKLNSFVQYYGADHPDAALLLIPEVGFLPATDPRMIGTVAEIERQLNRDGFILRYPTASDVDGLPPGEGAFLACSFWYVDNLALQGRYEEACRIFERLLGLRNELGLLAEEYGPSARRLLGNYPQAFSHVTLINSARNLARSGGPAETRQHGGAA